MQTTNTLSLATYNTIESRDDISHRVVAGLDAIDRATSIIQSDMLSLLSPMRDWSKKEICEDSALTRVFTMETTGTVRAKLIEWMEFYTPIKVKHVRTPEGKKTGKVAGIKLGKGEWNLAGAKVNPFTEFAASALKGLSDPKIERGIDAVVREVARKLDTDSTFNIRNARELLEAELMNKLAERIIAVRDTEKHQAFVTRYHSERLEAARAAQAA